MDQQPDDERLRSLLHDAVDDIVPADRLGEIRRRTAAPTHRRWWPVVLGAAVATAAVVVTSVVLLRPGDGRPDGPPVATSPGGPTSVSTPLYFLGDSPTGVRLYREFQRVTAADDPDDRVSAALQRLTFDPDDPDYRTPWPAGSFRDVTVGDDAVTVDLDGPALRAPAGADADSRRLAQQQVVYTVEAVLGSDLPVRFATPAGAAATRVLGAAAETTVQRDRQYAVVAPVNISDPAEGTVATDDLVARGTAATNVNRVSWTLKKNGSASWLEGKATVEAGDSGTEEFPAWTVDDLGEAIDRVDLAPGRYELRVFARTIGQTTDSPAVYADTRTVIVR